MELGPSGWATLTTLNCACGAGLGPWLDNFHGQFGVLKYTFPQFWPSATNPLLRTSAFVPPLFGLAGIIIGSLYIILDRAFTTSFAARAPKLSKVSLGVALFSAQYALSGLLVAMNIPLLAIHTILASTALLFWRIFDNTLAGAIVALMTAVGGPAIEVYLVNFLHLYIYLHADILGVDSWIPWVYMCGAPAVGNLARWHALAIRDRARAAD